MFKKVNVVMLPTDEKAEIRLNSSLNLISKDISDYGVDSNTYISCQHFYITSDDEIKEDDCCFDTMANTIFKMGKAVDVAKRASDMTMNNKKIIATTDSSLTYHDKTPIGARINGLHKQLPQISQQFIEHYISEYNKGNIITEVEVEYDLLIAHDSQGNKIEQLYLKINQDNTINIKPVKDSWNRDKVIELCKKAYDDGFHQGTLKDSPCKDNSFWIEENL